MAFETLVSIVESAGGRVATSVTAASAAESAAFQTSRWIARLRQLQAAGMHAYIEELAAYYASVGRGAAFQSAMAQIVAQDAAAIAAAADAAAVAAEGTLVAGAGTTALAIAVPVISVVAVGVALGAPYYQAREAAKEEEFASGFARGFVAGLIKWQLHFVIDRLWDNAVTRSGFDEQMPAIRAQAYNTGLLQGKLAGSTLGDCMKKMYLAALNMLAKSSTAGWNARSDTEQERMRARKVQRDYVVERAAAARRHGLVSSQ